MLTKAERLIIFNQLEILKHLDPDRAEEIAIKQGIVENGYEWLYSDLNQTILLEDPISRSDMMEVVDILDMFRSLEAARRNGWKSPEYWSQFEGFDGNNETNRFFFAKFLRRSLAAMIEATPHFLYAEVFAGMGSVFFRRETAPKVEVLNDRGGHVANLFRVLQNHYQALLDMMRWQRGALSSSA